jgi:hypothetical protein
MKKLILISLILATVTVLGSGCASIVDGRANKSVKLTSNPNGAKVTIYNTKGETVCTETTPATVMLKRHQGYFSREQYKLIFEAPGCYPSETYVQSTLNGWYFGNAIFGGLIGLAFVDPATGAMWTLSPREINRNLVSNALQLTPEQVKDADHQANLIPGKKLPPAAKEAKTEPAH